MYLKIVAQYQENYGYHDGKEFWKNKGGEEFIWKPSDDLYFYNIDDVDRLVAEELLKAKSNGYCRYILVDVERVFCDINDVSEDCDKIYKGLENIM